MASEQPDPVSLIGAWASLGALSAFGHELAVKVDLVQGHLGGVAVVGGAVVGAALWGLLRKHKKWDLPVAFAVWTPAVVAMPALVGIGVLGTVVQGSAAVFWFSMAGVGGVALALRRGLARNALARAVASAADGPSDGLDRLAGSRWVPGSVRDYAAYAKALHEIRRGDNTSAEQTLGRIEHRSIAPLAGVLLGLLFVATGREAEAEAALGSVPSTRSRAVRQQVRAVRLLQQLRAEGASASLRERAEEEAEDGLPLTRALAAWLGMQADGVEAVFEWLDAPARDALRETGMDVLVREVTEVLHVSNV